MVRRLWKWKSGRRRTNCREKDKTIIGALVETKYPAEVVGNLVPCLWGTSRFGRQIGSVVPASRGIRFHLLKLNNFLFYFTCNHQRISELVCVMKILPLKIQAIALVALATGAGVARAQTTVSTTPVGFISRTIAAATNPTTPSGTTLSFPLSNAPDFVSSVLSIDSTNQFTLTGAAWVAGQFAVASAPRLVRVKSSVTASNVGRFFLVTANTATQLTVTLADGLTDIHSALTVGDTCEVVLANTLGSIFGTAANPPTLQAGASPLSADNVLLFNGVTWVTYYWTGSVGTPANIWKQTGNIDRKGVIIYPDEAVFVIRRAVGSSAVISNIGAVSSSAEQSYIAGAGSTFLSNRFATDTTLGGLGLQNVSGWLAGSSPTTADKVLLWNGITWATYYWTGSVGTPNNIWKQTGNLDRSSTVIPAGTGVFILHAGAPLNLPQALPYTL